MGLLDDLLGPIRDLAGVKEEVEQSIADVTDPLNEVKEQVTQPLEGSVDTPVDLPNNEENKQ